jgi:ketosteroid isomerase-like protein
MDPTDDVTAALDAFDRAFATGDADALTACFADDARLLLLHSPAIRDHWARVFAKYDTSAWRTTVELVERHGDHAYTLATYTETLIEREGAGRFLVSGRLVRFLVRGGDGRWQVTLALNSHVVPVEPVKD